MRQKYDANLIVIGTGDPIAEFVLAMLHGLGMNKILGTLHVYPTWMEAKRNTAAKLRDYLAVLKFDFFRVSLG